jgi:ankyrin repeat domain-containing protein 50
LHVAGWNDWDEQAAKTRDFSKQCSEYISPIKEEEIQARWNSQLQEMQQSRTILEQIRQVLEENGKQNQKIYEDQKEKELLQALTSSYEDYKDFNPRRVEGTCEWFFSDDRFLKWRDSNTSSLLCVSAGPGCGKSVLSRALIDERRLSTTVTTSAICYFFFKDGDERRITSTDALCAMLHQLFTHDRVGSLISHGLAPCRDHGESLRKNFSSL